jgi:hypothetical protein
MQIEKIFKGINFKIKRKIVRDRQRREKKEEMIALNGMSIEQRKTFDTVKDLATKYKDSIRFDPNSSEIIIVPPRMLITLKKDTVFIDDINGFLSMPFRVDAYELLIKYINNEAHREKRKITYEIKLKICDFLTKVSENNKNE